VRSGNSRNDRSMAVRLYQIARGLEDEGQNNIAKLFRAASMSEIYRHSESRPRLGAGLEAAMRQVIDDYSAQESTSNGMVAMMESAADALERGKWPLLSDIPEIHVCRFCGEIMLGMPPEQCPACRSRRLTYHEMLPVFYLEPLSTEEIPPALRAGLEDVEQSVRDVPIEIAEQGPWPMTEIMAHLVGAQALMAGRARRMLDEENPDLGSVPPNEITAGAQTSSPSIDELLDQYRSDRLQLLETSERLTLEQWSRPGFHPEWGPLTVHLQLTYMIRHEQSHMAELQDRREGR
jgi:rubrerythrin